jgi:hypothetical protein
MPKTPVFFPKQIAVRFAPLQISLIDYCIDKSPSKFGNPEGFKDRTDFIRRAVSLQAKTILSKEEFELACTRAYKKQKVDAE